MTGVRKIVLIETEANKSENPAVSNLLMSGKKEKRMGRTCNKNMC